VGRFFLNAEQYLDQLDPGEFVEIGSSRNGGDGSTRIISEWAGRYGSRLYTVDMDPDQAELVRSQNLTNVSVYQQLGEEFLASWTGDDISFIYLDNFDWDWRPQDSPDFVLEQQVRYQNLGLTMNNVNSQSAHLAQMVLALPYMSTNSIVVCDDTWYDPVWGVYLGKSGAVVPYLLNYGYQIRETAAHPEYGTILTRGF
jgi:hypothetical protein